MKNTVSIPKFLHEVHGEKSNWLDIGVTHAIALFTVIAALYTSPEIVEIGWKKWVLVALAYDLGGGVVANFTYSTKQYYDQSMVRRLVFLGIHFLQPLAMIMLFPEHLLGIAIFSGYTVTASFITNAIQAPQKQMMMGAMFSLTGIIALYAFPFEMHTVLKFLLTLFLLKLPLSFSVQWYRLEKFDN